MKVRKSDKTDKNPDQIVRQKYWIVNGMVISSRVEANEIRREK